MTKNQREHAIGAAVCGAAVFAVFQFFGNPVRGYIDTASLFYWWGFQWVNPASEGEHGWLILGLSGWVLWRNLEQAESSELRAENAGGSALDSRLSAPDCASALGAIATGLALHAVGFAAQQTRVCIVAFLVCLWGVLRLGGGRRWGRAAAFPVAFLGFAIPLNLLDTVGFALRVGVVDASAAIARAAGIAVLQSGTQLVAPDGRYHYDVAAACSGVRSLTALVALTVVAAYLNFRGWPRRALIVALCLPLVYLGNVARIAAIVFAAQWGGPRAGDFAHGAMGFGIFAIVLGGVLLATSAVRRWWPEAIIADCGLRIADLPEAEGGGMEAGRESAQDQSREAAGQANPQSAIRIPQSTHLVVATLVVALALGEMFLLRFIAHLPPRGQVGIVLAADGANPADLPPFLGTEWIGQRAEVSAVEREVLPADTGFARRNYAYLADRRQDVLVSVVLSGRDRSSVHRPELCLVGQGWTIAGAGEHRFEYPGFKDAGFPATILRVRREVRTPRGPEVVPQLVAYWFVNGDRVVASHARRTLLDAWNRIAKLRADRWAYVLVQASAHDGEEAALARMQGVLGATLPAFQKPLPEER